MREMDTVNERGVVTDPSYRYKISEGRWYVEIIAAYIDGDYYCGYNYKTRTSGGGGPASVKGVAHATQLECIESAYQWLRMRLTAQVQDRHCEVSDDERRICRKLRDRLDRYMACKRAPQLDLFQEVSA